MLLPKGLGQQAAVHRERFVVLSPSRHCPSSFFLLLSLSPSGASKRDYCCGAIRIPGIFPMLTRLNHFRSVSGDEQREVLEANHHERPPVLPYSPRQRNGQMLVPRVDYWSLYDNPRLKHFADPKAAHTRRRQFRVIQGGGVVAGRHESEGGRLRKCMRVEISILARPPRLLRSCSIESSTHISQPPPRTTLSIVTNCHEWIF